MAKKALKIFEIACTFKAVHQVVTLKLPYKFPSKMSWILGWETSLQTVDKEFGSGLNQIILFSHQLTFSL